MTSDRKCKKTHRQRYRQKDRDEKTDRDRDRKTETKSQTDRQKKRGMIAMPIGQYVHRKKVRRIGKQMPGTVKNGKGKGKG